MCEFVPEALGEQQIARLPHLDPHPYIERDARGLVLIHKYSRFVSQALGQERHLPHHPSLLVCAWLHLGDRSHLGELAVNCFSHTIKLLFIVKPNTNPGRGPIFGFGGANLSTKKILSNKNCQIGQKRGQTDFFADFFADKRIFSRTFSRTFLRISSNSCQGFRGRCWRRRSSQRRGLWSSPYCSRDSVRPSTRRWACDIYRSHSCALHPCRRAPAVR